MALMTGLDPQLVQDRNAVGMLPALWAEVMPEEVALFSPRGDRTWRELNERANRLGNALRDAAIERGDHVALLCPNVPEFVEVFATTMRNGLRLIPVNWHLAPDEIDYIIRDSDAKVLIAHADFAASAERSAGAPALKVRLAIRGTIAGFDPYDRALAGADDADPADPHHGTAMLYTSGTTGRPKGVYRPLAEPRLPQWGPGTRLAFTSAADRVLVTGPLYHTAPMNHGIWMPMVSGVPMVLMERFGAESFLRHVEEFRVTHCHMVAVMFQRLLALSADVRGAYDLSSLTTIHHGAAPTPPDVKRAMLEWLGPIIHEYYGASEGGGGFNITPQEWLAKPGSVGRALPEWGSRVIDEAGEDAAAGEVGDVYFRYNPAAPFRYYKDEEKTSGASLGGTHFTIGDRGYLDEDGYLFLTGRSADCIISGGVNIYPQEIDNEIARHPAVRETCVVGVPNDEWGEEVRAVIQLNKGFSPGPGLADEILASVRPALASFKVPRSVDFIDEIPRTETGKVQRAMVRAPYWKGRARQI